MEKRDLGRVWIVSVAAISLTACEAVKFVFKAGFWVGALVVVALVAGIGYALSRTS